MLDLEPLYRLVSLLPFECLQAGFMQQALVALILLAPMAASRSSASAWPSFPTPSAIQPSRAWRSA